MAFNNDNFDFLMKPYNSFGLKLANKIEEHLDLLNESGDNSTSSDASTSNLDGDSTTYNRDSSIARANMINSASKNTDSMNAIKNVEAGEEPMSRLSRIGVFLNSLGESAKNDAQSKAEMVNGYYVPETNGALNVLNTINDGLKTGINTINTNDSQVAKDKATYNEYKDLGQGEVDADNKKQDQTLQLVNAKLKATQNDPMYQAKLKLYQNKIAEDDKTTQQESIKNTLVEASNLLNSIPEAYFGVGYDKKILRGLGMLRGTDHAQAYQDYTTRIHTLLGYIVRDMFKGGRITNMEVQQAEKTLSDPKATKQTNIDLLNSLMQKLNNSSDNTIKDHLQELNSQGGDDGTNVQGSNNTQTDNKYNIKLQNNDLPNIRS